MRPHPIKKRSDGGFTLVEVLITIGTLGFVATVISAAIIVIFRSEDGVVRLASESHDTQQGVNYFPLDVQAGPVEVAAYDASAAGTPGCDALGTNVLRFNKGGTRQVAYVLSTTRTRLDRYTCDIDILGFVNIERVNVADSLDSTVAQPAVANLIGAGSFVESIELRLAQDRTDARVVASPRGEPLNSPGDCQTANPIAASHGYGVFVQDDVDLHKGSMTGWLALGGSLSWLSDIPIATNNMSAVSPAYGLYTEDVNWLGSQAVTDLDVVTNEATVTVRRHGLAVGQQVVIDGTGNADIDARAFTITAVDTDTFKFSVTTGNTSGLTGTLVRVKVVTDLDVASNVATVTAPNHGFLVGKQVVIDGTGDPAIDGRKFNVTAVVNANTFRFSVTTPNIVDLTGTARKIDVLEVARDRAAIGGTAPAFYKTGDFVYEFDGSPNNYLNLSGPSNPPAVSTSVTPIVVPDDFDELRDCSAQIAKLLDLCALDGCANEVDVTAAAPVVNACSSGPVPQVLNVPEQYFDGTWQFDTSGPGCQGFSQVRPLLLNVIDCDDIDCASDGNGVIDFDATPVDWMALGDRKNILFNFPNSVEVNINAGFWGQVLAPFAHVTTNGNLSGGLIARQWTHLGGAIDSDDDLYNNPITWP